MEKTEEQIADGMLNKIDNKKSNLIKYNKVKGTPFTVVKKENEDNEGHEWYVLMGAYRLTEGLKTEKEACETIKEITWDKIMQVISILIRENEKGNLQLKG